MPGCYVMYRRGSVLEVGGSLSRTGHNAPAHGLDRALSLPRSGLSLWAHRSGLVAP